METLQNRIVMEPTRLLFNCLKQDSIRISLFFIFGIINNYNN